jgi:3-deoxy-D-manno-octulosonic acid kinase
MSRVIVAAEGATVTIHDGDRYPDFSDDWLDRDWWRAAGARVHDSTGRAGVLMLDRGEETWVYRHYHRGGLVSKIAYDAYCWAGAERTRSLSEWRVLDALAAHSLPSPRPVAARAVRSGLVYRADIVTVLLPDAVPLSSRLDEVWQDLGLWQAIGHMVARFHAVGCDHPDLNAHNILIDPTQQPFLVDFDKARLKRPGSWREANVARLKRSLNKIALETGTRFDEAAWQALTAAYAAHSA